MTDLPRWAIGVSMLLPCLVPAGWAIAAQFQPGSYSPVHETVSQLSGRAATDRWIVTAALYSVGIMYMLAAYGLSVLHRPARICLALAGIAALGVALFPEPAHGESGIHGAFAALGAVMLATWPAVTARQPDVVAAVGRRRFRAAIALSIALFAWTVIETRHGGALGLAERVSGLQTCWPFVVALALRRSRQSSAPASGLHQTRDVTDGRNITRRAQPRPADRPAAGR